MIWTEMPWVAPTVVILPPLRGSDVYRIYRGLRAR